MTIMVPANFLNIPLWSSCGNVLAVKSNMGNRSWKQDDGNDDDAVVGVIDVVIEW